MKYGIFIATLLFLGCANKQIIDPCEFKKKVCLSECKLKNSSEDFAYKACQAKCYAIFSGCKIKEKTEEGYEKTKEMLSD